MRIEHMTSENIMEVPDVELRNLKFKFINIYDRHFVDPEVTKAVDLDREIFYDKYMILRIEMRRRKVTCMEGVALDKEIDPRIFQKSVWGIDIPNLGSMMIVRSYVSLSGAFIKSPMAAEEVDVVVRNAEENRDERLEQKLAMVIKAHMKKTPKFIYSPAGPDSSYIPMYDLVLKSREDTRKISMAKKELRILKGAIPYADLGMAEATAAWAGAKETVEAEPGDLRQICAWYDSSKPDIKSSYKLPHHRLPDKKAVWRAVAAAMGALLGARGGVAIPDADRKGVYNHLAGHYKQFDKEVPELKKYDAEELEKAFPIEKPEESETTIRIPVGPECEVTATITISADEGIKALYCGRVKKIRTYLFDKRVKAWTMESARAWIKEHKEKMEKKLSEAQQKEYDEETALIRENAKKAKYPHEFKAAKWTHPNGHPRCIHCGDEERVDAKDKKLPCEKPVTKFTITKIDKKQQIVGGVVYEPDEVDTQGDYTDKKEIEKAMYRFMEKYATNTKRIRINHQGKKIFFPIVESFIPDHDTMKGDQQLKAGTWWLMIKITNDRIWNEIEKGNLTGFSMGGKAKG